MNRLFLTLNITLFVFECFSQTNKIDSLKLSIKTEKQDSQKVAALNSLSKMLWVNGDYDSSIAYSRQALIIGASVTGKRGLTEKGVAYTNLGAANYYKGNYPEALKNHFAALEIREALDDKKGIASSYGNIGLIYHSQHNYTESLKNNFACLKIMKEIIEKRGVATCYNNIGLNYSALGKKRDALTYYDSSLTLANQIKEKQSMARAYNNIGLEYKDMKKYPEALENYFASLKLREEINDKRGYAICCGNIGNIYVLQNKGAEGKKWILRALETAKQLDIKEQLQDNYHGLARADSMMGNWKSCVENYKLYFSYKDSLLNEENTKKTVQAQMQYEFDKKESATKAEQERKDTVAAADNKRQKVVLVIVSCSGLLVLCLAVVIFRSLRINQKKNRIISMQKQQVERQKHIVEEKQKEIIDSITYARRIQRSLLTSERYIEKHLKRLSE